MFNVATNIMVFLGAALMVYNIYGFIRFARYIKKQVSWANESRIFYIPIILLVFFLIGYLIIGIFGKPDLVIGGILFGGSIFVFIMCRFLSQVTRKILENERLEAELLAAEQSSQAKSLFLHSISHEMRTPMNVIIGLDTLALKNPNLQPETRDQLNKIGLSAHHLLGLINNILDINQIESGDMSLKEETFSLSEMTIQIDAILQTLCHEKGLNWHLSLDSSLPDYYIGDVMQIKKVLMSVLDNAVKYTDPPGDIHFDIIRVGPVDRTCRLRFTITDTGIGIDPDFLPRIFEVFSKEDASSTAAYDGGGLSLSVAKEILSLMDGEIILESEKGKGTRCRIELPLPLTDDNDDADHVNTDTVNISDPTQETDQELADNHEGELLEGLRILVVDDIEENAEIVSDLLELEGADSEYACNGSEALDMFQMKEEFYYNAILMDLRMPVMDGHEAARQIRSSCRRDSGTIPIIALTANTEHSDVEESMKAGMNAHLCKPVDPDLMYAAIRRLVHNRTG